MKKFNYKSYSEINNIKLQIILYNNILNKNIFNFTVNLIKFLTKQYPIIKLYNNKLKIYVNINKKNYTIFFYNIFYVFNSKSNLKLNKFNINNFLTNYLYKFVFIINHLNKNLYINTYITFNNNVLISNITKLKKIGFKF